MLEHLPPWLRHAIIIFGSTLIGVVAPALAAHQDVISLWLVTTLRLPVWVLPFVATAVGTLILRFTTASRQYGVGSGQTQPAVPNADGSYTVTDVANAAATMPELADPPADGPSQMQG